MSDPAGPDVPDKRRLANEEVHPKLSEERVVFQLDAGDIAFEAIKPPASPENCMHRYGRSSTGCHFMT
ncbi:hypothetical protein HaLaN_03422, partial [Haematococcus lacustris]